MEKLPKEKLIEAVTIGLNGTLLKFPCIPYKVETPINITRVSIKNNAIMVFFEPKSTNKLSIYADLATIVSFVSGLLGKGEIWEPKIRLIGAQAERRGKLLVNIISSRNVATSIEKGDAIFWLKNSIINDELGKVHEITFFIEGDTEENAFPILFDALGFPLLANSIYLKQFSKENIKSVLTMANYWSKDFFVLFDKDKENVCKNLVKNGLLSNNYHILENGEFEDYIPSDILAQALNQLTPGLGITGEYINEQRKNDKRTMDIIKRFYHESENEYVFPGKPALGETFTRLMAEKGFIPDEIREVIVRVAEWSK